MQLSMGGRRMGGAGTDTRMVEPTDFFERRHLAYRAGNEISQLAALPSCSAAMVPTVRTTFFQPSPMFLNAVSFFGSTKPEWTRRSRVPFSTLERMNVTTVSSREPYPTFPACPPFQA